MPQAALDLPQRVLVSGAAGGIGGAVARKLQRSGSLVIGSDRQHAPDGWDAEWIAADIAAPSGHQAIADGVSGSLGGLVLAAGILDGGDWQTIDVDAAAHLLAVNLMAPFFIVRSLLPHLETGASVVVIGSVAGFRASPATPFYAASKAGLRNLAASLALLLQLQGIRVNVLAPGLIDTPLTASLDTVLAERQQTPIDKIKADRARAIPMGRPGSVEEIADAALYLLSAQASYITGATLSATGGVLAGAV